MAPLAEKHGLKLKIDHPTDFWPDWKCEFEVRLMKKICPNVAWLLSRIMCLDKWFLPDTLLTVSICFALPILVYVSVWGTRKSLALYSHRYTTDTSWYIHSTTYFKRLGFSEPHIAASESRLCKQCRWSNHDLSCIKATTGFITRM